MDPSLLQTFCHVVHLDQFWGLPSIAACHSLDDPLVSFSLAHHTKPFCTQPVSSSVPLTACLLVCVALSPFPLASDSHSGLTLASLAHRSSSSSLWLLSIELLLVLGSLYYICYLWCSSHFMMHYAAIAFLKFAAPCWIPPFNNFLYLIVLFSDFHHFLVIAYF